MSTPQLKACEVLGVSVFHAKKKIGVFLKLR